MRHLLCTLALVGPISLLIRFVFSRARPVEIPVQIREVTVIKEVPIIKEVLKEIPVVQEVLKEVPVIHEKIVEVEVESEVANKRLRLLNEMRTTLWEKELLVEHFTNQRSEEPAPPEFIEVFDEEYTHPAVAALAELRKQFNEKSDAFHRLRQQMFALEGDMLALQLEKQETDTETTEQIASLMQALGEAEHTADAHEEHILALHRHISPPKKPARRKKAEAIAAVQAELFETVPPKVTVPRHRKKRTASLYFADPA